jgi:release factor glutamine methyltransferase
MSSLPSRPPSPEPAPAQPPSPQPPADIVTRLRAAGCVFAEDEARILLSSARNPADLDAMTDQRATGVPLELVVGWAEFWGLRMAVEPGVFVPRRRTEFLVRQAVTLVREQAARRAAGSPAPVVVDLCCGSGALGAALATALHGATWTAGAAGAELHATDIHPAAVRCARRNVAAVAGRVYQGDLYEPLPATLRGRVEVLLANVPYVPTEEIGLLPPEAREHEPRVALDGGPDGLDVLRRVADAARDWLAPGGFLLTETSEAQVPPAVEVLERAGLAVRVTSCEELNANVIIGTSPGRLCRRGADAGPL